MARNSGKELRHETPVYQADRQLDHRNFEAGAVLNYKPQYIQRY